MDNRKRALAILKQAQEILEERLSESIVECASGILDDAEGSSYSGEIDTLQESVGGRLNNINLMISNLPTVNQSAMNQPAEESSAERPEAADEASSPPIPPAPPSAKPTDFALFGQQIAANNLNAAAHTLAQLLKVDPQQARDCATTFRDRLIEDPKTVQKAMRLREKIVAGKNNDSLMILWHCFGLQGIEAIGALQSLKARLSSG